MPSSNGKVGKSPYDLYCVGATINPTKKILWNSKTTKTEKFGCINTYQYCIYLVRGIMFAEAMMAGPPMMAMAKSSSIGGNEGQGPRVRTLFPETWVYESAKAE
jgi:hypothetical protein